MVIRMGAIALAGILPIFHDLPQHDSDTTHQGLAWASVVIGFPDALYARLDTPRIERIWETYNNKPQNLARAVRLLREMKGFGQASLFYEGVETNETWEKDWQPVAGSQRLTPVMLILVLDLYFRLTPATMVTETPEVKELSKMLKISTGDIVEVMDIYLHCDPYLNRRDVIMNPLLQPCLTIWQRYGNADTEELAKLAEDLKVYYL